MPEARSLSKPIMAIRRKRTYKLFVLSVYRGQPLPLVVMLHGCTQSPDDFAAGENELHR
jgi:poly(3-hydroxybutyrate) depolymerase